MDPPSKTASKAERLAQFLRRLGEAPAAQSYEEARQQLSNILNAVEDEMTDIPYNPRSWRGDGRLYPPQDDREVDAGHPELRRFRSLSHSTVFGANGSIRILEAPPASEPWTAGAVILDKPGQDGRRTQDL